MSDISLDDKVVIVTGASQGLGRTMALGLAGAGARLVITSIDGPKLAETAEEIAGNVGEGRALAIEADINERTDCERVLEETRATFDGLHVLVNNARRLHRGHPSASGPFWKADHEYWRSTINTNVGGSFLMAHTMTPHMIEQGWGRIVNIAERTVPGSLETIPSAGPVKGVLELNGGTAARLGIMPGDRVVHPMFQAGP